MSDYPKNKPFNDVLTLIWVGFSWGFVLRWGGGGGGPKVKLPPPCLKLVTILLETSNLVHKYTSTHSFKKYTL